MKAKIFLAVPLTKSSARIQRMSLYSIDVPDQPRAVWPVNTDLPITKKSGHPPYMVRFDQPRAVWPVNTDLPITKKSGHPPYMVRFEGDKYPRFHFKVPYSGMPAAMELASVLSRFYRAPVEIHTLDGWTPKISFSNIGVFKK